MRLVINANHTCMAQTVITLATMDVLTDIVFQPTGLVLVNQTSAEYDVVSVIWEDMAQTVNTNVPLDVSLGIVTEMMVLATVYQDLQVQRVTCV